jgi:hypothetical protein
MTERKSKKVKKPWDLFHLFQLFLREGLAPEEITEFGLEKDYANKNL